MKELRDDLIGNGDPGGALRSAMANFATGVSVVTAIHDGKAHAMTANSFTAISLNPPLVMVSIRHEGRFHPVLMGSTGWAVSILNAEQSAAAKRFAKSGRDLETQFDGVETTPSLITGAPWIVGAMAWLECQTETAIPAGDHTMVLGRVVGAYREDDDSSPLIYFRGGFHSS